VHRHNHQPVCETGKLCDADAHKLPFADGVFDRVNFFEVIEHVEQPVAVLKEIYRVLNSAGVLCVSTPNPCQWRILLRHMLHMEIVPWRDHIYLWGLAELRNLLRTCGFRVVYSDYIIDADRERFESPKHRVADKVMHSLSLWHALTGRSVYVEAVKQ